MSLEFSLEAQRKIAALCERYAVSGTKQPVVMAALHLAQKEHGHLSDDALPLVARTLDPPHAHGYGARTPCRTPTSTASRRSTRCIGASPAAATRSGCARTSRACPGAATRCSTR